jgi:hypothetical protein
MIKLFELQVDYLAITTFNQFVWQWIEEWVKGTLECDLRLEESIRIGAYKGIRYQPCGVFLGESRQKDRAKGGELCPHYMLVSSGSMANRVYEGLINEGRAYYGYDLDLKVPRMDVQMTFPESFVIDKMNMDIEEIAQIAVMSGDNMWVEEKPHVAYHQGCTLYLGTRGKDLFRRLYLKEEGERLYRFETEFRNYMALQCFKHAHLIKPRFLSSWHNLPIGVNLHWLGDLYQDCYYAKERSDIQKKKEWLEKTVFPAIKKEVKGISINDVNCEELIGICLGNIEWVFEGLVAKNEEQKALDSEGYLEYVSRETKSTT